MGREGIIDVSGSASVRQVSAAHPSLINCQPDCIEATPGRPMVMVACRDQGAPEDWMNRFGHSTACR